MAQTRYISVILPLRLEWVPCYSVPEELGAVRAGERVKVRFANRIYIGVVLAVDAAPDIDPSRVLPIMSVEKDLERISPQEIELWRSISEYYLCDIGEVYKAAYPLGKINMEEAGAAAISKTRQRREKLADGIREKLARLQSKLEKKKEMLEKARKDSARAAYSKDIEKIEGEISVARASLDSICGFPVRPGSGVMEAGMQGGWAPNAAHQKLPEVSVSLSDAQNRAYNEIKDGFNAGKPVMLNGVTGSGKTEIYIRLAHEAMSENRNVLYLVPEIALSRQLEDRLQKHFGDRLLTFHSGKTAAHKRNTAWRIRNEGPHQTQDEGEDGRHGDNYILLGTRSSVFLPHHDLGLIIVDEEHDSSYKQDSPAPRYNGRDTALMMSQIHKCSIVLGSATPSLEEMYNCQAGRHVLVELKEKFHGTQSSDIEIIDTKAERRKNGMVGNFSRRLIDYIDKTLERGEQVMILRSRRAWATMMQCEGCGEITKCPHCNVSLSRHRDGRMVCHYCGHTEPYTGTCKKCGGTLNSLGVGTQRIEDEAEKLFPNARIARLDSDTAQSRTYETKTIREFSRGNIDILIGTQIVTKGFDFSNLMLVAVIAADALLGIQDFRADEKAFQLLEQFRGRSGRRGEKGMFMIQTSQPEHPVYQRLLNDASGLLNMDLLHERKEFNFPPYSRIIEITIKDLYEDRAERMAWKLGAEIRDRMEPEGCGLLGSPVTGPYAPSVDRIADHYIRTIRVSLKKDRNLSASKAVLKTVILNFEKSRKYDGHITINVDPS